MHLLEILGKRMLCGRWLPRMASVRALIRRLNVAWIAARAVSPNAGSATPAG
jgi:hypothetical protein